METAPEILGIMEGIEDLDSAAMDAARARQDNLTKPAGSLGLLEELSIRLAGITGGLPRDLGRKLIILCAADHGVVEEGVSAYPQEVTGQMLLNFAAGGAAINVLAREIGARVVLVDVGVKGEVTHPSVLVRKVRRGTANFRKGPAMSRDEAQRSVLAGAKVARAEIESGAGVIACGEMGIGNTTAAAALATVFTGTPVDEITGRGTGIDDEALLRKVETIEDALKLHDPSPRDPIGVLAKVGGLEIGALAGVMLEGARGRVPVLVDGFISGAAALVAVALCPISREYLIATHLSAEPGHRAILDDLGLRPFIHLGMRLGEGTGAALAIPALEASVKLLGEMATFEKAGVDRKSG